MKRVFSVIMVCLLCLSMFTIFTPKTSASSDLLSLPAAPYGWQYSDSSHNRLMVNPLAGPLVSASEQSISASPGQTVTVSVTYQVFAQSPPNNPSEIDQLFFVESWTTSWPPQGYTIPLYNGIPGLSPGVTQTNTISFIVPSESGTYYLWLCFEAQYSMQDAVNQRTQSMSGLPGHIKIVVSAPTAYLTDIVQLTTNPYPDREPFWSPDGSKITYFAFADSWYRNIWVMNADGSNKIQLTFGNVLDESGGYSPDGTKIAFIRYVRAVDRADLMIMNSDGTNVQQLTNSGLMHQLPKWSHDGTKLAFFYGGAGTSINEIHIMNADGTGEVTVVSSTDTVNMNPSWSPDDTKLVYSQSDGIWLVSTTPPYDKTHLFTTTVPAFDPVFSPDGKYILYSTEGSTPGLNLCLIDSGGNFIAQLTSDSTIDYPFDWSPDGHFIAFGSTRSGNTDIWRARIVTDSGFVGYWKFDEGSGNVAYDSSGNGNTGTVGGAQWVDGVRGKALRFDGVDDYVYIPHSSSLDLDGYHMSVEFWMNLGLDWYPGINHENMCVYDKGDAYTSSLIASSGALRYNLAYAPTRQTPETTKNSWTNNTWFFIAEVYDDPYIKIYVNGVLDHSELVSGPIPHSGFNLCIGAHSLRIAQVWFNGVIDEFKIYNYARTAQDILKDYNSVAGSLSTSFSLNTTYGGTAYEVSVTVPSSKYAQFLEFASQSAAEYPNLEQSVLADMFYLDNYFAFGSNMAPVSRIEVATNGQTISDLTTKQSILTALMKYSYLITQMGSLDESKYLGDLSAQWLQDFNNRRLAASVEKAASTMLYWATIIAPLIDNINKIYGGATSERVQHAVSLFYDFVTKDYSALFSEYGQLTTDDIMQVLKDDSIVSSNSYSPLQIYEKAAANPTLMVSILEQIETKVFGSTITGDVHNILTSTLNDLPSQVAGGFLEGSATGLCAYYGAELSASTSAAIGLSAASVSIFGYGIPLALATGISEEYLEPTANALYNSVTNEGIVGNIYEQLSVSASSLANPSSTDTLDLNQGESLFNLYGVLEVTQAFFYFETYQYASHTNTSPNDLLLWMTDAQNTLSNAIQWQSIEEQMTQDASSLMGVTDPEGTTFQFLYLSPAINGLPKLAYGSIICLMMASETDISLKAASYYLNVQNGNSTSTFPSSIVIEDAFNNTYVLISNPPDGQYNIIALGVGSITFMVFAPSTENNVILTTSETATVSSFGLQSLGNNTLIDYTPPSTKLDIGKPMYHTSTGYYVTNTTLFGFTADDENGSGVACTAYRVTNNSFDTGWTDYDAPFTLASLSEGSYELIYNSSDNVGNVEASHTVTVIVDNTAPSTNVTIGNPQYSTSKSIFVTPSTPFTLTTSDGLGSGVAFTSYMIWNSTYSTGWLNYAKPFNLSSLSDGNYIIAFSCTDNVGNAEATKTVSITLARTIILVSGSKIISLTGSDNVIILTGGNDIIDATQATATTIIKTGLGNDILKVGAGNNIIIENAGGNDIITTGNGNNTITITGNGSYQITTGSGNDQIQITGDGNSIINAGDGNNIVTVSGKGNNQITTGSGNDVVVAGNGNNIIKTGARDDSITVGNGNNTIDGGTGYDACIHGTGHNTILNCEKT